MSSKSTKTKKSASKRFKLSGRGLVTRRHAKIGHNRQKEDSSTKQSKKRTLVVSMQEQRKMKRLLGK